MPRFALTVMLFFWSLAAYAAIPLADRLAHLDWLFDELDANYPSLDVKQRQGLRFDQLRSEAHAAERDGPGDTEGFELRIRSVLARFQDVHLRLGPRQGRKRLSLPAVFREVEGDILVVASRTPGLPVGSTLLAYAGEPAEGFVSKLQAHIPASSPAGARHLALQALSERDFLLPGADGLRLCVQVDGRHRHVTLDLAENASGTTEVQPGAHDLGPLDHERRIRDGDAVLARLGVRVLAGAEVAVLQLHGFPHVGSPAYDALLEAHLELLDRATRRGQALLLDVRENGGGDGQTALDLVAMLAGPDAPVPAPLRGFRASGRIESMLAGAVEDPACDDCEAEAALLAEWPRHAARGYTDLYPESTPLDTRGRFEPFRGPAFVFSGPGSVSSTDMLVNMLGASGRAQVLGSPSHGSGSGYIGYGASTHRPLQSPDGLFAYVIPNKIVAQPVRRTMSYDDYLHGHVAENQPFRPHVSYRLTRRDALHGHADFWSAMEAIVAPSSLR